MEMGFANLYSFYLADDSVFYINNVINIALFNAMLNNKKFYFMYVNLEMFGINTS